MPGVMDCSVAFTYLWLAVDALVRSTVHGQNTQTQQTGSLLDGAECYVSTEPALQFYPEYIPAANELIEVSYRGQGHAAARVIDSTSIAAHQRGGDDGVRGGVREIAMPVPRTSADCETAALTLLDDAGQGSAGEYKVWSQFLPGSAADIFPGDELAVNVPSRVAMFAAIVHEVEVEVADIAGENIRYTLRFVDAGDPALAFAFATAKVKQSSVLTPIDVSAVGKLLSSRSHKCRNHECDFDDGHDRRRPHSCRQAGIEVRYSDAGWGIDNTRNLIGRYTSRSFTLMRYARAQDYFLRSYDNSAPPKYSRYSTALHVDYPL